MTLQHLNDELVSGIKKRGHPYRFFTLATLDGQNRPKSRTVVLRDINKESQLFFFTDARSKKLEHLERNPIVSALFYNPKTQLQIHINGQAIQVVEEAPLQHYWALVGEPSKRDYSTSRAPGSPLQETGKITYLRDTHHFSVVKILPQSIEYLKLQRPDHLRGSYTQLHGKWKHQYLVP